MKIIMMLITILLSSCSVVDGLYNWGSDMTILGRIEQFEMIREVPESLQQHIDSIGSYSDDFLYVLISDWMKRNVYYKYEDIDVWSSPVETLQRGYGDCEDYSLLFMNLVWLITGEQFDIVLVEMKNVSISSRAVLEGGKVDHAIVRHPDGRYMEPQRGRFLDVTKAGYIYYFSQVFKM